MNISKIFIERPVATSVLVSAIIFFGLFAFRVLPVNELPNVDFPTIQVTAELRGANPEIMASTVATPLERQFSQIAGVDSMDSLNIAGRTRITLQFSLERDIDSAAQDVQTAISQAMRRLPEGIEPPSMRNSSREMRLLMATLPLERVILGLAVLRSMMTESLGPGTLPLLQLPALFQSPSASEIQAEDSRRTEQTAPAASP